MKLSRLPAPELLQCLFPFPSHSLFFFSLKVRHCTEHEQSFRVRAVLIKTSWELLGPAGSLPSPSAPLCPQLLFRLREPPPAHAAVLTEGGCLGFFI